MLFVIQSRLDLTFSFFFQSYKSAKPFQFKVLQNWDDIVWIGEKEGIAASLDKMVNSFDRMLEKIDGKVDDEDIQEVLSEAALIPYLN